MSNDAANNQSQLPPAAARQIPDQSNQAHSLPTTDISRGSYGTAFDPSRYSELNMLVQKRGMDLLLSTISFPNHAFVVDVGSGHGRNTAEIAKRLAESGGRVIGIDKAPGMIELASSSFPSARYPNLEFLEGNAHEVGEVLTQLERITDQKLPAVTHFISNYTLHWVRDPADPQRFLHQEMFTSMNRRQDIGGEMHHFCAEADAFKELFEAGYSVIRENARWSEFFAPRASESIENGEWRHPRLISESEIANALTNSGYHATLEKRTDERVFPSPTELKGWVGAMIVPFMTRIPESERPQFVDQWIGRYLQGNPSAILADGSVVLLDRNLLIRANKIAELAD